MAVFPNQVGTYTEGFAVVIEPTGSVVPGVYEPVMRLACLDASLAIRPVFERFSSVSGEALFVVIIVPGQGKGAGVGKVVCSLLSCLR